MGRTFTTEFLTDMLADEEDTLHPPHLLETKATGKAWDHALVEEWQAVFMYEGVIYAFTYQKPSRTAASSGDGYGPFDNQGGDNGGDEVECQEMVKRQVTVTVYEPRV